MTCPNCTQETELQHVCERCGHRADASQLAESLIALARAAIQFADDAANPLFGPDAREKKGARLREMAEKWLKGENG